MSFKSILKKAFPLLTAAFIIVVLYFLIQIFSNMDWAGVQLALQQVSLNTLLVMLFLVLINYCILSIYDYLGFNFIKTRTLEFKKVMPTALISYAFNFNLGAFIGGLGFRIRMYSGWGIPKKITTLVALFSVTTTWLGYTLLISLIITFQKRWIGDIFEGHHFTLQLVAILGIAFILTYLYLCHKRMSFQLKNNKVRFPKVKVAVSQFMLASAQWSLASFIVYVFMRELNIELSYGSILFTYLAASLGGVIARIPAGLGVLEAIFIKMYPAIPGSKVLAALLCFRAVYYIVPLIVAIPSYIGVEVIQNRKP